MITAGHVDVACPCDCGETFQVPVKSEQTTADGQLMVTLRADDDAVRKIRREHAAQRG